ncbi:hypothetical protein PGT21_021114 [Puccinia graminis f. sp. tritici]|uniref:Uncharacterized protein n=1 Tax=Puccinia graminis f. sp. tritici TaxID=56615 RepID=A0A5B0MY38_PUCGR|nr:hypothetical protein PGT21_021114 [Puccinia graminis f. sp. tritici]
MHANQTTTDQSDLSGPDDSSYNSDPEHPASEEDDQTEMQTIASEDVLRDIHGISMSASTLTRRQKTWGLRQLERQQPTQPELLPHIRASLLSSHSKGLNLQEIQARLAKETGVQVCLQTVKRYLRRLRVKLNVNDLALGNVTLANEDSSGKELQHPNSKVRYLLISASKPSKINGSCFIKSNNNTRQTVYDILLDIDPEAMTARLRQT